MRTTKVMAASDYGKNLVMAIRVLVWKNLKEITVSK